MSHKHNKLWTFWEGSSRHWRASMSLHCWRVTNPELSIETLDKEAALDLFPHLHKYTNTTVQRFTDILRLSLIFEFGGMWSDLSVLPMKPIASLLEAHSVGGTFLYKFDPRVKHSRHDGRIATSWFLVGRAGSSFFNKWLDRFLWNLENDGTAYKNYFLCHTSLTQLYDEGDVDIVSVIDGLRLDANFDNKDGPHGSPKLPIPCPDKLPFMYKRPGNVKWGHINEFHRKYY